MARRSEDGQTESARRRARSDKAHDRKAGEARQRRRLRDAIMRRRERETNGDCDVTSGDYSEEKDKDVYVCLRRETKKNDLGSRDGEKKG